MKDKLLYHLQLEGAVCRISSCITFSWRVLCEGDHAYDPTKYSYHCERIANHFGDQTICSRIVLFVTHALLRS